MFVWMILDPSEPISLCKLLVPGVEGRKHLLQVEIARDLKLPRTP